MSTQSALPASSGSAAPKWATEMRYVARQPILDLRGRVHAYELLFRNGPEALARRDADMATRTMLDNAVIIGLEWFTNGLPAFVNCNAEALTEHLVEVLAPETTVLSIPASLEQTPSLVEACRELKASGFRLALDGFAGITDMSPLLDLVDYIRVEFARVGIEERRRLHRLRSASIAKVAKGLETQKDFQQASAEGFTLFQGNYFCHPVLLKKAKIPANRLFHFEIMRHLLHDPINLQQVSRLVMRDAALTYRLLRLVNSPVYAIRQEVRSIESAIIHVGEDTFRRIVSLSVLSELNADQPPEILHMALVRAQFCKMAAELCKLDPSEQYLLGMLSLLPAMLCLPMEELTPSLPVRDKICDALQGTPNPERSLLSWLEFHESGDWAACDRIAQANALSQEQLVNCYTDAVVWAQAALSSAVGRN